MEIVDISLVEVEAEREQRQLLELEELVEVVMEATMELIHKRELLTLEVVEAVGTMPTLGPQAAPA